ncbi:diguanylate cyclase (GGDEF) domain-containing protein [Rhizobium sp. RU35A]|nr:diguanylate cyclase (GGDEF) domain-containing protein [Rhizobium sp. RU35A]
MLDYKTLVISLGVSALCLLLTLFGTWFARRGDGFLLSWVIGMAFLVPGIFSYSYYTESPSGALGALCFVLVLIGFAIIYAAAFQFRTGRSPVPHVMSIAPPAVLMTAPFMLIGYDGIGFVALNIFSAFMLFGTAAEYAKARRESPGALTGMAILYGATGLSFVLCALVLIHEGQWVLGHAPTNWAEDINTGLSIAGMTGVGALSLMVHQGRITARHRREAMTDALTGLNNRRALFERHERDTFSHEMAVIVFDIDRFKTVNDQYGHAAGDRVICALADELKDAVGVSTAARLGGEEFAAVLMTAAPGYAEWLAERIRRNFAERDMQAAGLSFRVTVSAGIAYGLAAGRNFDGMLSAADSALYEAKRNGRNRTMVAAPDASPPVATRTTA